MDASKLSAVKTRFIARSQLDTLRLHHDLCLQVLNDYGCEAELVPNPVFPVFPVFPSPDDDTSVVSASWPRPGKSERANYTMAVLPRMVEEILHLTEQLDAKIAATAIG